MVASSRGELVLVALASLDDGDGTTTDGTYSMGDLIDALDLASDRLSQQMALATTLRELRGRGLVDGDATSDGSLAFKLTDAGAERATSVRERLSRTPIEVDDGGGDRRTLPLEAAAAEFDRTISQLAAALTDGDVYYHDEGVDERVVGREDERERCREALETCHETDRGGALLVTGPGGIGKTTFVEDVLETAHGIGYDTVQTRCRGADGSPYHPLSDLLSQLDGEISAAAGDRSTVEDPDRFQNRRTGLFYDLTDALTPDEFEPSRALFLDDLHLADSGTIAYLAYLSTRLPDLRLVLLASYRPAEFSPGTAFEAGFDDADGHVTFLRLPPLDCAGTRDVIEQTTGYRGAPAPFVEAIHEKTGGNPLFVEETITALIETNQLDPRFGWYPDDPDNVDVPTAVREAINDQVDALPASARTVLGWAAAIGDRVPVPVLERLVDHPTAHVETVLELLVEAGVFDRTSDHDVVTFRSEVVRDAIRGGGEEVDERVRHAAIADALETEYSSREETDRGWAASIATHHERAGNTADAIEWYHLASEQARDVYAHAVAVTHLSRALELAREIDDDASILAVNEQLVRISLVTAAFDRAERHLEFARERETEPAGRQRLAALATRLATLRGEYDTAVEHADEGIALDGTPSSVHCRLLLGRADAEDSLGAFEDAIATTKAAYEMATDVDEPELVMEAQYRLGEIAVKQARHDDGRRYLRAALALAERLDDRPRAAGIHLALGSLAYKRDDLDAMEEHNTEAIHAFEGVGDPHGAALARANLAMTYRNRGEYDRARTMLRRGIETLEALGDHHSAARNRGNLASIALSQGDLEAAREYYEEALSVFERVGERRESAIARTGLGAVALKRGRYDRARDYYLEALEAFEEMEIQYGVADATLGLGIVDTEQGNYESAHEPLTQALETLESIAARGRATNARLALAHLDTVTESPPRGLEHWDGIAEGLEALDPSYSVEPFERLLRACRAQGDLRTALEWCDRTIAQLDAADADGLSRLRDRLLDRRAELEADLEGA